MLVMVTEDEGYGSHDDGSDDGDDDDDDDDLSMGGWWLKSWELVRWS